MPTDLQLMYANERMRGAKHHAALRGVAARTGIDKDTVDRCLRRARRTDELETRRRKPKVETEVRLGSAAVGDSDD